MFNIKVESSVSARQKEESSEYMAAWRLDKKHAISYLQSRKEISRQQEFLHGLLRNQIDNIEKIKFADIACGAGWSSFHISNEFGIKNIDLYDLSSIALNLAEENSKQYDLETVNIYHEDISRPVWLIKNKYDLIINLMTLCCIEEPEEFLQIC